MNENEMIINYDELIEYISTKTDIDTDTVQKVLDAETDYMVDKGIILQEG